MEKSELQKMLAGECYWGNDPELQKMRTKAHRLYRRFNQLDFENGDGREGIIRSLLGSCGKNIQITPPFYCDYGVHIHLGDHCYMNFNCIILDCAPVKIGNNVLLGPMVQIYTAYHPLDASERLKGPEMAAPVTIGENVWVGGGAIICQGVEIGANTTIGAGSVVVKDIPENVFAAGNPCRVIRKL